MPYAPPGSVNQDGLMVRHPNSIAQNRRSANKAFQQPTHAPAVKAIEIDYDFALTTNAVVTYTEDSNNDGVPDAFNKSDAYLPARASVLRVTCLTVVPLAGGTSFTIGTFLENGTAVSANSLVTATEGVIANFATIGTRTFGAGALVATAAGTASVGASDVYIGLTPTGTFTAGQIRVIIEYMDSVEDT